MTDLTEKHPIKRMIILRQVLGKIVLLIMLSMFLIFIFKWNGVSTTDIPIESMDLVFSTLLVAVFVFLLIADIIYEWLYILNFRYYTDGKSITICKGVISKHEITLPFKRITDLYIDQGIIDRVLGLNDLHFSTPTSTSGSAAHIAGLGKHDCKEVRDLILKSINDNNG